MIIVVQKVQQSFDGGKTLAGMIVDWRLDRENPDMKRHCEEMDRFNHALKEYDAAKAEFFTWTEEYEGLPGGKIGEFLKKSPVKKYVPPTRKEEPNGNG